VSAEEAQKILAEVLEKLLTDGVIDDYSFEMETDAGTVTEKCILSEGRVVA
jgi:hypothetical protein